MVRQNSSNWAWAALVVVLSAGCAHESAQQQPQQTSFRQQSLSPTSDRQDPRVYAESPPTATSEQSDAGVYSELPAANSSADNHPPKGAPSEDWALAQEIRDELTQDKTLAGAPMQAYVDKGVVTLKGYARNERERKRLREKIAGLPGVKDINDQLQIRSAIFGWGGTNQ